MTEKTAVNQTADFSGWEKKPEAGNKKLVKEDSCCNSGRQPVAVRFGLGCATVTSVSNFHSWA